MVMQFRLFGHLQVQAGDQDLFLRPRAQRLLAYLLLHRKNRLPRKSLAFILWPDMPETEALGMLRRALNDLRTGLGSDEDYLLVTRGEIQWDVSKPYWLDLDVFETEILKADADSLRRATELYKGDLLWDMDENWLTAERERYRQMQSNALRKLTAHYQALREYATALDITRKALLLDPFSEPVYQDRMRVHFLAGDRASALAEYDRLQFILHDELGVEPMEETRTLADIIIRGEPLFELDSTLYESGFPPAIHIPVRMVGREPEARKLSELWEKSARGQGILAVVSGEAGVGKSHLLRDLTYQVSNKGGLPLIGYCYEFENTLPYQPIVGALRSAASVIRTLPLPSTHQSVLSRLLPDMFEVEQASQLSLSPDELRGQLFETLFQVFALLSQRRPILLVFEDLHWASESILDWLTYVAPRLPSSRLMVVITYRMEEIGTQNALPRLARRFEREDMVTSIPLQPLSREANREWVMHLSGLEAEKAVVVADRLFKETGGNPFFLQEVVRGMLETGQIRMEAGQWSGIFVEGTNESLEVPLPESLRDSILARTERLDEMTRSFLQVAAVAGRTFQYLIVSRAGGWKAEPSLEALENLRERGFIREEITAGNFVFAHHLIREAIYSDFTTPRRAYWHLHLAGTIEEIYPDDYETIAYHLVAAGERQRGADYSQKAAQRAESLYAYEDASRHYRTALDFLDDGDQSDLRRDLLESLGDNCRMVRQSLDAISAYQSALGIINAKTQDAIIIEARLYRKIHQTVADMWENARLEKKDAALQVSIDLRPKVDNLLTILQNEPPHVEMVNLLRALAVDTIIFHLREKEDHAFQFARRAVELARSLDSPLILSTALTTLATVFGAFGFIRERLEVAQEALELSRETNFNDPLEHIQLLIAVGSSHAAVGEYTQAMIYFQDAERIAAQSQAISDQIRALSLLHLCLFRLDRWDEMLEVEDARRVLQETYPSDRIGAPCYAIGLSSAVHAWRGNIELSKKLKDESSAIMLSVVGSMENFKRSHYY